MPKKGTLFFKTQTKRLGKIYINRSPSKFHLTRTKLDNAQVRTCTSVYATFDIQLSRKVTFINLA